MNRFKLRIGQNNNQRQREGANQRAYKCEDGENNMNLWQRWKKVSINNQAMIYMTFILAAATTLYTFMYRSSVKFTEQNAKQTAEQTDRLIAANEQMANATVDALNEAKRQNEEAANRAERATNATENAAGSMASQANASQNPAKAAKISAGAAMESARLQRESLVKDLPLVHIVRLYLLDLGADKVPSIVSDIKNDGGSFALCVTGVYWQTFSAEKAILTDPPYPETGDRSVGLIAPGQVVHTPAYPWSHPFSVLDIEAIRNGTKRLRQYAEIEYDDGNGHHYITHSCFFLRPRERGLWSMRWLQ